MRDRLVELLKNSSQYITEQDSLIEKIADYLLDNGVIVPPCKVGQNVYYPSASFGRIFKKPVDEILMSDKGNYIHFASTYMPFENIGKTVFLTREDAEAKQKEGGEG